MERKLLGVLVLKHIPSWNSLYRYGNYRFYKTKLGRKFEKLVASIVPLRTNVNVVLEVYADKGNYRWDVDNLLKSLLDSLKRVIYEDDSQVDGVIVFKHSFGKRRIEVRIWEVKRSGVYHVKW